MSAEQCISRHGVTAQDVLDEMEAKRRQKLKDATAALKIINEKERQEMMVKKKEAYEDRLRIYRGIGVSEEEAKEAGRRWLRSTGQEAEAWAREYMGLEDEGGDVEMADADADATGPAGADTKMKDAES